MNPIKQDVKKGNLRFVDNVFPYKGYMWNYGALPQTWEDPSHVDGNTEARGDNDPIDACEIGSKVLPRGKVITVKVLGVLAMIDEGETDWKVIVINTDDPLAEKLNDINDVEENMPGLLKATHDWFKYYKVPTGKPVNEFAFDGQFKDREFALKTVMDTHSLWKQLISGKVAQAKGIVRANVTVEDSPYRVPTEEFRSEVLKCAPLITGPVNDPTVDHWHFSNPEPFGKCDVDQNNNN